MPAPLLFQPFPLCGLTLPNRIVVAPMCQYSAEGGMVNSWHLQHYGALAASGPGMIVVESTAVTPEGRISIYDLGLWDDRTEEAMAGLVATMKSLGQGKVAIQLGHAGRKGADNRPWPGVKGDWEVVGPSPVAFDQGRPVPRQLDRRDMDRLVEAFVGAARRCLRIGFDVIELHSAHGYLLNQFLSPLSNVRADEYGGSLENRMRFPLEVVKAVRAVVPAGVPLGIRISATDWARGGFTLDDSVIYAKAFKELGIDYVCVSSAGVVPGGPPAIAPGYQVPLAERIRKETGLVTRAVGLIVQPGQAEAVLADGKADLIALGRAFLADPRWVWRAAEALGAKIDYAQPYARSAPALWPGAALMR